MKKILKKIFPGLHKKFVAYRNKIRGYGRKSFSQFGEDIVLATFLDKKNGFYIDVGAYNPEKFSNTYFFYQNGWSGINIDARPGSMIAFNKKRKRDINLEIGISKDGGDFKFYIFEEPAYNTFSEITANRYIGSGIKLKETRIVKTDRLDSILDRYLPKEKIIDFLTVDVEGMDMFVLQSNNWLKYTPSYILVETNKTELKDIFNSEVYNFLIDKKYKLISVVYITLIFKYEPAS